MKDVLEDLEAAIGDRLLAKGPLSKAYAFSVITEVAAAYAKQEETIAELRKDRSIAVAALKAYSNKEDSGHMTHYYAESVLKELGELALINDSAKGEG